MNEALWKTVNLLSLAFLWLWLQGLLGKLLPCRMITHGKGQKLVTQRVLSCPVCIKLFTQDSSDATDSPDCSVRSFLHCYKEKPLSSSKGSICLCLCSILLVISSKCISYCFSWENSNGNPVSSLCLPSLLLIQKISWGWWRAILLRFLYRQLAWRRET